MSHTRIFYTLCGLSAAVSLSCYRSGSVSVSSLESASRSSQSAPTVEDRDAGVASLEGAAAPDSNEREDRSAEGIDAEVVLKTALTRAADEQKLVLVHLGAPG